MKCICSDPCELWQELQEAKDKFHFLDYDCLPAKMEENYERFNKDSLRCYICFMELVKAAAANGETTLTAWQANYLEQKLIKTKHYYEIASQQRASLGQHK